MIWLLSAKLYNQRRFFREGFEVWDNFLPDAPVAQQDRATDF